MPDLFWGGAWGELELRRARDGSTNLSGRFPYGEEAVLSDGGRSGRPRKEIIESRAFGFRVDDPEAEIHLLSGHSFDKPLASRGAGTLDLKDTAEALTFDATITREIAETTHGRDALALITAGLSTGISPGFRMPPERAVPRAEAETIEEEPVDPSKGQHGAIIRRIRQALLFELSVVTRPAYPEAQIEARNWTPGAPLVRPVTRHWRRWRL